MSDDQPDNGRDDGEQPPSDQEGNQSAGHEINDNNKRRSVVEWLGERSAAVQAACAIAIVVLTMVILVISFWQWSAMDDQLKEMREERRPIIGFGSANGELAEYIATDIVGYDKGTIQLFFRNTGNGPALNFLVNAHGELDDEAISYQARRLVRTRSPAGGFTFIPGITIPAQSGETHSLEDRWVPNSEAWAGVAQGRRQFKIFGTFEYCDTLGGYQCESFAAVYRPALRRFVRYDWSVPCDPWQPDPSELVPGEALLAPCEQPDEKEQRRNRLVARRAFLAAEHMKQAPPPVPQPLPQTTE